MPIGSETEKTPTLLDDHGQGARDIVVGLFDLLLHARSDVANALRNDEVKLTEQATNLIDLRRVRLQEAFENPEHTNTACCSTFMIGTKLIFSRPTASHMTSASAEALVLVLT